MRVLIATDGSARAQTSLDLAADLSWPEETVIRVVAVVEPYVAFYGAPFAPALPAHVDRLATELEAHAETTLEAALHVLARTGRRLEKRLLRGRPGSAIVDEAANWSAELVILGSRGHGAMASMLLGSVSAEVVDHAPCPVLIARRSTLTRVILGHDGSSCALAAEQVVARWGIFEPTAVEVVSVARAGTPWHASFTPVVHAEVMEAYVETVASATAEHTHIAEEATRRLHEAGRRAKAAVVSGDPAASLVRVSDDHQADLIVVGTHGRTGMARALLGSVARNVMQHASCSVLVVRSQPGANDDHAVEAAMGAGPTD